MAWHTRLVVSLVVIALTTGLIASVALAVDASDGRFSRGYAIAIVLGAWIIMQLLRLGYEYDDGIDVKLLLLPAPFDWNVKLDRLEHFWLSPQMWFRSAYLGSTLALVIVVARMAGKI
jgi:hypothetical protein